MVTTALKEFDVSVSGVEVCRDLVSGAAGFRALVAFVTSRCGVVRRPSQFACYIALQLCKFQLHGCQGNWWISDVSALLDVILVPNDKSVLV